MSPRASVVTESSSSSSDWHGGASSCRPTTRSRADLVWSGTVGCDLLIIRLIGEVADLLNCSAPFPCSSKVDLSFGCIPYLCRWRIRFLKTIFYNVNLCWSLENLHHGLVPNPVVI